MDNFMHAITIKEPWLWLILNKGKDVENRTWSTNYRGRLYLHSSKSFDYNALKKLWKIDSELCREVVDFFEVEYNKKTNTAKVNNFASFGKILGFVELVDCVKGYSSPWAETGLYHWVLKNPQLSKEEIECKGKLGVWTLER
ncbi:MAG: ASCH domain-containing protein [Bacilli bacterium]